MNTVTLEKGFQIMSKLHLYCSALGSGAQCFRYQKG